jgi:hypothetical protein
MAVQVQVHFGGLMAPGITQYRERHDAKKVAHYRSAGKKRSRPDREEYHKRGFGLEPKAIQIQLNDVGYL